MAKVLIEVHAEISQEGRAKHQSLLVQLLIRLMGLLGPKISSKVVEWRAAAPLGPTPASPWWSASQFAEASIQVHAELV